MNHTDQEIIEIDPSEQQAIDLDEMRKCEREEARPHLFGVEAEFDFNEYKGKYKCEIDSRT